MSLRRHQLFQSLRHTANTTLPCGKCTETCATRGKIPRDRLPDSVLDFLLHRLLVAERRTDTHSQLQVECSLQCAVQKCVGEKKTQHSLLGCCHPSGYGVVYPRLLASVIGFHGKLGRSLPNLCAHPLPLPPIRSSGRGGGEEGRRGREEGVERAIFRADCPTSGSTAGINGRVRSCAPARMSRWKGGKRQPPPCLRKTRQGGRTRPSSGH